MCTQVPAGSLPRTMEVIFRNDIVEQARAGDKLVFSGSLVVVPDVSVITAPGQRSLLKGAGGWPCFTASSSASSHSDDGIAGCCSASEQHHISYLVSTWNVCAQEWGLYRSV